MASFATRLFSRMVYMFKTRPTADQIATQFKDLESRLIVPDATNRCDCLVEAGGQVVFCKGNIPDYECSAFADENPTLVVSPLPVGGCQHLPK